MTAVRLHKRFVQVASDSQIVQWQHLSPDIALSKNNFERETHISPGIFFFQHLWVLLGPRQCKGLFALCTHTAVSLGRAALTLPQCSADVTACAAGLLDFETWSILLRRGIIKQKTGERTGFHRCFCAIWFKGRGVWHSLAAGVDQVVRGVTTGDGASGSQQGYPDLSLPVSVKKRGRLVCVCVIFSVQKWLWLCVLWK